LGDGIHLIFKGRNIMNILSFLKIVFTSVFLIIFSFVANASKEIKIGVIFDYTGPLAGGGSDLQALGVKIIIDHFNKNGGVEGYKINALYADA
jgi:branched-chain amino acid transport system substrate-binding protein